VAYEVTTERREAAGGLDGTVYVLADSTGWCRAEIWPALGFNCIRWQVAWQRRTLDLLYSDPQLFENPRPTRSGIPVLFPFPNRIRDGRFDWQGKSYQLPPNDPSGKNAIHGFACRKPWRAVGQGADDRNAWLTGEFRGSVDAPESLALWPGDYQIRLTYRVEGSGLRLEAEVTNPGAAGLPFGLGYHPYFRVPLLPGAAADDCWVQAHARESWDLHENLPDGTRRPVSADLDLTRPRQVTGLSLDHLLTALGEGDRPARSGLHVRASLEQRPEAVGVHLLTCAAFRELVVFTPPHRQAFCLEPYTCTTDAINLQQQGVDAGLIVLAPGAVWSAVVELRAGGES
jgi:aldose 1-epimerase